MRKNILYIVLLVTFFGCSSYSGEDALREADMTLAQADSLENTINTYADTLALQEAVNVYHRIGEGAKETKTIYHLGKAYLMHEQDSMAALCFQQAAKNFLIQSDSIYYPLSVLEMSLIAERQEGKGSQNTMLHELRYVQREMIRGKAESNRWKSLWWLVLLGGLIGGSAVVYILLKKSSLSNGIARSELERNIELILSQGSVKVTLHWNDYNDFCRSANAYFYNVIEKLQKTGTQLSEQDIRFCVLVLLDLSAKEIADIMMLSQNSISNKKTRTAQKLGTIAANLRETIIRITLKTTKQ